MTVNVGLGTGSKSEQLAHLQLIIAAQEKAAAAGLPIVTPQNFFNSAKQLTRLAGHPDVEQFFAPPGKPPDPNNPAAQPIQTSPIRSCKSSCSRTSTTSRWPNSAR
jgi:hypothetical protein